MFLADRRDGFMRKWRWYLYFLVCYHLLISTRSRSCFAPSQWLREQIGLCPRSSMPRSFILNTSCIYHGSCLCFCRRLSSLNMQKIRSKQIGTDYGFRSALERCIPTNWGRRSISTRVDQWLIFSKARQIIGWHPACVEEMTRISTCMFQVRGLVDPESSI